MKRVIAAVGALTLMSVGAANAAVATYDFEDTNVPIGTRVGGDNATFASALANLGITSSTLSVAAGTQGVYTNGLTGGGNVGANAFVANSITDYKLRSFAIGNSGVWTLNFGSNSTFGNTVSSTVTSFDFAYNETESSGFTIQYFNTSDVQIGGTVTITPSGNAATQCQFANTCNVVTFTSSGGIGRVVITDLGGDNAGIDNLRVTTTDIVAPVPEPGTYAMIGSALAALGYLRRRRNS